MIKTVIKKKKNEKREKGKNKNNRITPKNKANIYSPLLFFSLLKPIVIKRKKKEKKEKGK